MGMYESLGVRRVINAAAAQTVLGGSIMPEPVLAAMHEAGRQFISLPELHDRVAERIAELTRNEAACVTAGAAAGVLVASATCLVRDQIDRVTELPDTSSFPRNEIIAWKSQHNGFLSAVRETGATLVEIGPGREALEAAITDRTAGILWFAGTVFTEGALPLNEVIRIGKERGVPVVVDAADQVPPAANLWRFTTEMGADLAIFSGGKGLRGPQSSGIIVGRADLIRACRANSGPYHSIGRPAKVGKEEFIGLLTAIELAVTMDETAETERYHETVDQWQRELADLPGYRLEQVPTSHIGQPIPRLVIRATPSAPLDRDALIAALWEQDPRIAVLPHETDAIALNPHLLEPGDAGLVAQGLLTAITGRG
jgi:L-seryl-tRNA(Ser) seleniumtransferase